VESLAVDDKAIRSTAGGEAQTMNIPGVSQLQWTAVLESHCHWIDPTRRLEWTCLDAFSGQQLVEVFGRPNATVAAEYYGEWVSGWFGCCDEKWAELEIFAVICESDNILGNCPGSSFVKLLDAPHFIYCLTVVFHAIWPSN
jgi:hypothetical protein